jgi:hypothetical protein
MFLRGVECVQLDEEWVASCGQLQAVLCTRGTDAMTLAAIALDLSSASVQTSTLALTASGLQQGAR